MSINSKQIFALIGDTARATGLFDSVIGHEPKSAPQLTQRPTYAYWLGPIRSIQSSGLTSVSVRLEVIGRVFINAFQEPADSIETDACAVVDRLAELYCGDFELGGNARMIDIFGSEGDPLSLTPGYMEIDKKFFRVVDLMIPILINDAWTESP